MESVAKLLADLVAIPSMNPMGRKRDGPQYSEKNIAEYIGSYLKRNAIDVEVYDIAPGRPNVMGFVDAKAQDTLLLEAHMDTVHADNMSIDPFTPVIREEKLYGRGSCDTKGSLAASCHSVISLLQSGRKLRFNILFLFVSDEEYRFGGAQAVAKKGMRASFGINGEPTSLAIVRAHKGVTRLKIRTKGLATHSAYPERGENAIYRMAPVVERLERLAKDLSNHKPNPLLGTPSLSVGVIEGGQAVNTVPDECWIDVDRRSIPGETTESILESMKASLNGLTGVQMDPPYLSVAGMDVHQDVPIVKLLSQSVKEVTGSVQIEAAPYATDAGIYNTIGIPTVVFGPGNIAEAHTHAEFIELKQLEQSVLILQRLIAA